MFLHSDAEKLEPCLPGFESINRFWDPKRQAVIAKILPGEFYITRSDELIATVLGSCVSACIRDKMLGLGGMNHFMLPHTDSDEIRCNDSSMRYGSFAMEQLINEILKLGGHRERLEIKLTGGGKILSSSNINDIGDMNVCFVRQYLNQEGLATLAEDLGGDQPRKVLYQPTSGRLRVKKLVSLHNDTLITREQSYRDSLKKQPLEGDIELF